MSAADERVAVYDAAGRVTGAAPRGEVYRRGLWHAATGVLVRSGDGERVVLHRRTADKLVFADTWDCWAGGVVGPGEDPADAAVRELAEELGITGGAADAAAPRRLRRCRRRGRVRYHAFTYEARWDGPLRPEPDGDRLGGLGDARPSWSNGSPTRRGGRSRPTDARGSNAGSPRRADA